MSKLAPTLQLFFTERLAKQLQASPRTVTSYRDTFRLLLRFVQDRTSKAPSTLGWEDVGVDVISAFLDHLQADRHNSARSRNTRLAALRSLFRYTALRHPEHAELIGQVLAIPQKRFDKTTVSFLDAEEVRALLGAPDIGRWEGRRDRTTPVSSKPGRYRPPRQPARVPRKPVIMPTSSTPPRTRSPPAQGSSALPLTTCRDYPEVGINPVTPTSGLLDNLGIHTPKGSRLLRALLQELGQDLLLADTPTYDPDANRIEWLWRSLRRTVTHTHRRRTLVELLTDAQRWAHTITPAQVLSQIGSPFAPDQQPPVGEELNHAA